MCVYIYIYVICDVVPVRVAGYERMQRSQTSFSLVKGYNITVTVAASHSIPFALFLSLLSSVVSFSFSF